MQPNDRDLLAYLDEALPAEVMSQLEQQFRSDPQLVRPAPVSGFPEWLPEVRLVELHWLDSIRMTFERYGFCSIETPSVEALDVLMAKGETSQEVYTLRRLQAEAGDDSDARLGLHFDLTVPFARYVAQKLRLESGVVQYQTIAPIRLCSDVSECIHAVADVDPISDWRRRSRPFLTPFARSSAARSASRSAGALRGVRG